MRRQRALWNDDGGIYDRFKDRFDSRDYVVCYVGKVRRIADGDLPVASFLPINDFVPKSALVSPEHKQDTQISNLTFVQHSRCGYDNVCVVFIFKPLSEHVHVQRSQEAEATSLAERGGGLARNLDAAIRQGKLAGCLLNPEGVQWPCGHSKSHLRA